VFHVEKMKVNDLAFAVHLANTMNWNMTPADFIFNMKLEPDGCFVLFNGQERKGIATSINFGKVGWFGNLVVKEDSRQEGAGKLLVKHVAEYLRSNGVETIGLYAYPNLIKFYESIGFESDLEFSVLKGKVSLLSPIREKVEEAKMQDIPSIVAFDRHCFRANRQKLLETILFNQSNLCYISTKKSEVIGYVAAKVGGEVTEVGPLICRADHYEEAVILLETILKMLNDYEVFVYIPKKETALIEMSENGGLKEDFRVMRMFLGPAVAANCVCAAESLERG
jgi:GNAT superfamily N-acetyltransferase